MPTDFSAAFMQLKDAFIGYFTDYIMIGLSPYFSRTPKAQLQSRRRKLSSPPLIPNLYGNKTNVMRADKALDYFADRFLNKLLDHFEENERKEAEEAEFQEFLGKRNEGCNRGFCDYVTKIIDEMELKAAGSLNP